jgi:hypothetical protein
MRRLISIVVTTALLSLTTVFSASVAEANDPVEMNLNQTILVWNEISYPDFSNYDIAMSTVSTLTGDAAQVGYTFQPALDPGPCPAPFELYNYCGGPVSSAALNPVNHQTYGLVSGADSPNSMIYSINPQTAEPSFVSVLSVGGSSPVFNIRGIFFDSNGDLYAWYKTNGPSSKIRVYSVDLSSGTMTLAQEYLASDFGSGVTSITLDPDGVLWAFSAIGGNTSAATITLSSTTVTHRFDVTGTSLNESAFDANGYLWFDGTGDNLYTLDVAATDPSASLQLRAQLPASSGAFVISDVPFPTSSGVSDGDKFTLGENFSLNIENARASSDYSVEIHSTPIQLAAGAVASVGSAQIPLNIPSNLAPGNHEIVVTYIAPNGRPVTQTFPVTVEALAATGFEMETPATIAVGFLVLGLLSVIWAARREKLSIK